MNRTSNQRRGSNLKLNRCESQDARYRMLSATVSETPNAEAHQRQHHNIKNNEIAFTTPESTFPQILTMSTHTTPDSSITMSFSFSTTRRTLTILILIGQMFLLITSLHLIIHINFMFSQEASSDPYDNNGYLTDRRRQLSTKVTRFSAPSAPLLTSAAESSHLLEPAFLKRTTKRTCTSPEKDVPWIFGIPSTSGCRSHPNTTMMKIVQSRTSDRMCGYCMDDLLSDDRENTGHSEMVQKMGGTEFQFAKYLHDLSQQLRALKEKECSSLIVYGVAFGENYTHWLTRQQADPTDDGRSPDENIPFKMSSEQVQQLLQRHGPCFITFVLAEHVNTTVTFDSIDSNNTRNSGRPKYFYSNDGLQLLIPIQREDLPYTSMRRNTKIFKMIGPSYLFGNWVQRVVWQDAKLVLFESPTKVANNVLNTVTPHDYFQYFFKVILMTSTLRNTNHNDQVCASFMGLPYHKNTMGTHATVGRRTRSKRLGEVGKRTVQFRHHCDAIAEAANKRPTVSDDLHSVQYQCSTYNKQVAVPLPSSSSLSWSTGTTDMTSSFPPPETQYHASALDDALIDSALIVWDLRSERCQNFVATISCTWLDEIHCYSDRDQVSFPYVFLQMGLQIIPTDAGIAYHDTSLHNTKSFDALQPQEQLEQIVTPETHHRLFAHSTTPLQPLVHIAKSSCHWYYNNLNDCDFTQNDPPGDRALSKKSKPEGRMMKMRVLDVPEKHLLDATSESNWKMMGMEKRQPIDEAEENDGYVIDMNSESDSNVMGMGKRLLDDDPKGHMMGMGKRQPIDEAEEIDGYVIDMNSKPDSIIMGMRKRALDDDPKGQVMGMGKRQPSDKAKDERIGLSMNTNSEPDGKMMGRGKRALDDEPDGLFDFMMNMKLVGKMMGTRKRVLINELEMISDALDSLDEYDRQLAIGYIEQGDEDSIHNLLGF